MEQTPDSPKLSSEAIAKPRLRELFQQAMRRRNYSRRTEKSYWFWIRRFIFHNGTRHPSEMGAAEVERFLSWLATERNVAAATQNQALSALLFLYKQVLVRTCHGSRTWCARSARCVSQWFSRQGRRRGCSPRCTA